MSDVQLISAAECAKKYGVSLSHFDDHIRPFLPKPIDVSAPTAKRPMNRWLLSDIDADILRRAREKAAA